MYRSVRSRSMKTGKVLNDEKLVQELFSIFLKIEQKEKALSSVAMSGGFKLCPNTKYKSTYISRLSKAIQSRRLDGFMIRQEVSYALDKIYRNPKFTQKIFEQAYNLFMVHQINQS